MPSVPSLLEQDGIDTDIHYPSGHQVLRCFTWLEMSELTLMNRVYCIVRINLGFCIFQLVLLANIIVRRYLPGTAEDGMWHCRRVASPSCGVPGVASQGGGLHYRCDSWVLNHTSRRGRERLGVVWIPVRYVGGRDCDSQDD